MLSTSALAWMYRKDYARAGYAMLPVVEPSGDSTARQTLLFTLLLAPASLLPTVVGVTGGVYLAGTPSNTIPFTPSTLSTTPAIFS